MFDDRYLRLPGDPANMKKHAVQRATDGTSSPLAVLPRGTRRDICGSCGDHAGRAGEGVRERGAGRLGWAYLSGSWLLDLPALCDGSPATSAVGRGDVWMCGWRAWRVILCQAVGRCGIRALLALAVGAQGGPRILPSGLRRYPRRGCLWRWPYCSVVLID